MSTHPHALPQRVTRLEAPELREAWRLLRGAAELLDRIAAEEGWPVPFSPVRYLVLAQLQEATAFGLSPRRLARLLAVPPSTLAHHLDALEEVGLVSRRPLRIADMRKVAVRLTERGRSALRRFGGSRTPAAGAACSRRSKRSR